MKVTFVLALFFTKSLYKLLSSSTNVKLFFFINSSVIIPLPGPISKIGYEVLNLAKSTIFFTSFTSYRKFCESSILIVSLLYVF